VTIHQDALPPYTMRCSACGQTFIPQPAKGKPMTTHRLDQQATKHWATCPSKENR
jgi:hypothetical protein